MLFLTVRLSAGVPAILSFSQQEPDTARKIYYTIKLSIIIIFEGIISSILSNLKVFKSLLTVHTGLLIGKQDL